MSATKFGIPILACICSSRQHSQLGGDYQHYHRHQHHQYDSIIVCSLQHRHRRDGVIPTTNTVEKNGLVRQLVTRDDVDDAAADIDTDDIIENDTHSLTNDIEEDIGRSTTVNNSTKRIMPKHAPRTLLHTAMVVSGIRADADYLSDRLRSHAVKHWFRYDTPPSLYNMAEMVRDVMLDFLGYDRGEEVRSEQISGGIGSAAPSYSDGGGGEDDDEDNNGANSRAGRPLGVSVFLLGGLERVIHGDDGGGCGGRAEITSIEADGSSRTHVARAMGVGSQFANKELSHRWKKNMCVDEAKEMMRSVMKDVAREVGWLPHRSVDDANDEEGQLTMVCEIVTSNGTEIDVSKI